MNDSRLFCGKLSKRLRREKQCNPQNHNHPHKWTKIQIATNLSPHETNNPHGGIPPINEGLIIDTVRIEAERQRREQQERDEQNRQRQAQHDRTMVRVTQGLLVATLITAVAALYQAHSSAVNASAAIRAVQIAEDTRDDSDISSGDTLIAMKAQSRAMQRSAEAAIAQTKLVRE